MATRDVTSPTKICPGCKTEVPAATIFCRRCGQSFSETSRMDALGMTPLAVRLCPDCRRPAAFKDTTCGSCGFYLGTLSAGWHARPKPQRAVRPATHPIRTGYRRLTFAGVLALLGAVAMGVGSLGPWADPLVLPRTSTQGDPTLTLAAAVCAFVFTLLLTRRHGRSLSAVLASFAALAGGALGVVDYRTLHHELDRAALAGAHAASIDWGLYAVIWGATVVILGAITAARS